jgi:hypothetical protein
LPRNSGRPRARELEWFVLQVRACLGACWRRLARTQ